MADRQAVKADVGLSNVDNTSDANKPVSTAQATALGLKADSSVVSPMLAGWTVYTPVATPSAGSLGTGYSTSGRYKLTGKTLDIWLLLTTGAGCTASGSTDFTLPLSLTAIVLSPLGGYNAGNGANLSTMFASGSAATFAAGALGSGASYIVAGRIEVN